MKIDDLVESESKKICTLNLQITTLITWLNYITTSQCIDHTVGSKIEYMYTQEGRKDCGLYTTYQLWTPNIVKTGFQKQLYRSTIARKNDK